MSITNSLTAPVPGTHPPGLMGRTGPLPVSLAGWRSEVTLANTTGTRDEDRSTWLRLTDLSPWVTVTAVLLRQGVRLGTPHPSSPPPSNWHRSGADSSSATEPASACRTARGIRQDASGDSTENRPRQAKTGAALTPCWLEEFHGSKKLYEKTSDGLAHT